MKKIIRTLTALAFLLLPCVTWAQSCYNSVGYFPSWQGSASAIDYSKWTHVIYAFGIPNSDGTIGPIENSAKLVDLVNRGRASNTKVLLAIGGWLNSSPGNTPFESISTNSTAINTFVNSCANLITQYNLDGIDIDWEYPTTQGRWNAVINPLASRIHGMGKLLTAAVAGGSFFGNGFGDLSQVDLVNIMAYDCNCPTNSPYSAAVDGINYWAGRGVPKSKCVLGLPFYSSDNYTSLHVQKTEFAKSNASGIMVWEISSPGDINAIVSTLGTLCKGTPPPPGIVTTYKDCNYTGTAVGLPVGDYTLAQLNSRGILNNDLSSLRVTSGYQITLYDTDNFTGASLVVTADNSCLVGAGWNDRTTSARVATNTPPPSGVTTVYQDCSYGGTAVGLPVGDYNLSAMTSRGIGNDWISSIRVTSGYRVTLYEHDNYTGASLAVTADNSCLVGAGWNDRASSMRVATNGGGFSTIIQAENWLSMSGVQTEACSEGGLNVGWIDAGDWMAYNVTIPATGTYRVIYRISSPNPNISLRLEKDNGTTQLGTVPVTNTGGWQNWQNVAHNVTLPAGTYPIGIATSTGGFNINYFTITNNLSARSRTEDGVELELVSEEESEFFLYPNPVQDQLYLGGIENAKRVKVYNMQGMEMISVENPGSSISVQSLTQGLHIAVVEKQGNRIVKQKFFKK